MSLGFRQLLAGARKEFTSKHSCSHSFWLYLLAVKLKQQRFATAGDGQGGCAGCTCGCSCPDACWMVLVHVCRITWCICRSCRNFWPGGTNRDCFVLSCLPPQDSLAWVIYSIPCPCIHGVLVSCGTEQLILLQRMKDFHLLTAMRVDIGVSNEV